MTYGPHEEWKWVHNDEYDDVWDLMDGDTRLADICPRPAYCDRGHWLGNVEIPGLDNADMWPNYYMSLQRAKDEIRDFLKWRIYQIPYEAE